MTNLKNNVQVYGLVCPYTCKIQFIEIAKNARTAYQHLLQSSHLFKDALANWIDTLQQRGMTPGLVILDDKTSNGSKRRDHWVKYYRLNNQFPAKKEEQCINMETPTDADLQYAQHNSTEYEEDSE